MKKILILGTGNAQEDIIRYCKENGFEVYACSYTAGDNAEKYADHFSLINITDINKLTAYIKDNQIGYVYSVGSDIAMPSVSAVAEKCGLAHFISHKTAFICNNKNMLREYLGKDFKGNLSYIVLTECPSEISLEFPVVIKPVDSQGQRGVAKVNNMQQLKSEFDHSIAFSKSGKVIVEEYIEGPEISVNAFVVDKKIKFSLISDREVWDEFPGGIIKKHLLPSRYSGEKIETKILDLVKRVTQKLEIENGPAYFQIKVKNNEEPKLLEVTPRLDGCHMWRLIREYTGVDLLDASMRLLQGEIPALEQRRQVSGNASLAFMCAPPGTGFDKSRYNTDGALFVKYYYENGQIVKRMNGYMEKCGYIIRRCE